MRLTVLNPAGQPRDLALPDGASFAAVGGALREFAGLPAGAVAHVEGAILGPGHVSGIAPLADGAIVRSGPLEPDPATQAARAAWHWACTSGPGAGDCLPPPAFGRWRAARRGKDRYRTRMRPIPRATSSPTAETSTPRGVRARLATLAPLAGAALMGIAFAVLWRNPVMLVLPLLSSLGMVATLTSRRVPARRAERLAHDPAAVVLRSTGVGLWGEAVERDGGLAVPSLGLRLAPGQSLAIVGEVEAARALARLAVAQIVTSYSPEQLSVSLDARDPRSWAWARWLPHLSPGLGTASATRLHLGAGLDLAPGGESGTLPGSGDAISIGVARVAVPGATYRASATWHRGRLRVRCGAARPMVLAGLGAAQAESLARRLAARYRRPAAVSTLRAMLSLESPTAVERRWRTPSTAIPLGVGESGEAVVLDLVRDGPHLLVAGTTGSGKSQALRTLALALAATNPPDDLAIVALDHKGGATFRDLAGLPHLAALVDDLDLANARRALGGIGAELRRRERLFDAARVADFDAYRACGGVLARLVVMIDEFRALTDDLPELAASLTRLAAQGRSLGMHLVLATQRPAGAVNAEMRSNVTTRLCCRVASPADSLEVVGVADAAALPSQAPGSAILDVGGERQRLRVALADAEIDARVTPLAWPFHWEDAAGVRACDARLVHDVAAAAATSGRGRAQPLWLDPLPEVLDAASLLAAGSETVAAPAATSATPSATAPATVRASAPHPRPPAVESPPAMPGGCALPLALADVPEELRREICAWDPGTGPLLVVGAAASGRTSAARALAHACLAAGVGVHVVTARPAEFAEFAAHHARGTVLGPADDARLGRLVALAARSAHRQVVVVDDADACLGPESPIADTLRGAVTGPGGLVVALCGSPALATGRLGGLATTRVILPTPDITDDLAAGVPRELATPRSTPGRAVWRDATGARLVQLALPRPLTADMPRRPPHVPRLEPVPICVRARDLPGPTAEACPIGLGGDDATVQWLPLPSGAHAVVAASCGTQSDAVATLIAAGWERRNGRVERLAGADPRLATLLSRTRADLVVIDGLDPATAAPSQLPHGTRVIATTSIEHAQHPGRGLLAMLVADGIGLVLGAPAPASIPVLGTDLRPVLGDLRGAPSGRGAMIVHRRATVVQCPTTAQECTA